MRQEIRLILCVLLMAVACVTASAEAPDSLPAAVVHDSVVQKKNIVRKVLDYFSTSNRTPSGKGFDVSVIGGPHYSSDTKFGIGLVAAGFYRTNRLDSLTQPSNVSLYGDVASTGFYLIGIRGDHIFRNDNRRIDYNLHFYSFPRYFWGLGYEKGNDMDNKSRFKELYVHASADYLWRLVRNVYFGPAVEFAYVNARNRHRPELWDGQDAHVTSFGAGFRAQFDNRDNLTAPTRGFLLQLEQRFLPGFLGNDYAFSYTDLRMCAYRRGWKGAVLAARFHTRLAYGNVPWNLMSTFGGSNSMRGYYDGRFRDKGEMDLTLELRQHVWRRNGLVFWLGAGTVYPKLSKIRFSHILPNGGIGYRWEFKKLTNVRLDYGFARGEKSFIFSINEAF